MVSPADSSTIKGDNMTTTAIRRSAAALVLTAAVAAPLAAAGPAQAKGGNPAVKASGSCVGGGSWELKAKHDDGRVEVEFEVDTNRAGQLWHVVLTDNNVTVLSANKRTVAPSGSFSVRALITDRPGVDTIRAHATFASRSCAGSVRV
jgi:hypothetical protein